MKTPFWFRTINPVVLSFLPLSIVYWFMSKFVFIIRRFCRFSSKTPVICIGGLLAGGVGKTPIVREIARHLNACIVMRGYKGKKRNGTAKVRSTDSAKDVGDEAKMLSESGLSVYVGNRRQNIESIDYNSRGVNHESRIVLDDGFQNPSIKKDISIIVFDESIGCGNGFILPAGPMRETLRSGIRRSDAVIIVQGDGELISSMPIIKAAKKRKKPVFFARKEMDTKGLFGKYVAFAGIGYPEKFFGALHNIPSIRIIEKRPFSDHRAYTKVDIVGLFKLAKKYDARLLCTEKDWVKLPRNIRAKVKFVPLKITIQPNFYAWIEKKLEEKNEGS